MAYTRWDWVGITEEHRDRLRRLPEDRVGRRPTACEVLERAAILHAAGMAASWEAADQMAWEQLVPGARQLSMF